jgi:hypothetical protein
MRCFHTRKRHLAARAAGVCPAPAALPLLLKARGVDDPVVRRAQTWLKTVRPEPPQTASAAP